METAIECTNITKSYDTKKALQALDLKVPANQVTAVLGPNGSGKSTLFRLMAGIIQPDSGRIRVLGQSPGWKTNAQVAYLPDRAQWYARHTVKQALDWGEALLPAFHRERAEALAENMQLALDMPVSGLSKGQEARLMLILCMARDVPLILLDEPFSGIDIISRERIMEVLIQEISRQKQTLLISTHEIYDAEGLFEYAVFLEEGRVCKTGIVEELRQEFGSMEMMYRQLYR